MIKPLSNWFRKSSKVDEHPVPTPAMTAEERISWDEGGFLILERFFSDEEITQVSALVDQFWDERRASPSDVTMDIFLDETPERVKLHDAPDEARHRPYKMNDLFLESEQVRALVLAPRLAAKLNEMLGGSPLVCNTLNFEFGSSQPYHTDSLYMTPPRDFNLVATWIALEDVHPDSGPLRFYAGSHKIPPFLFSHGRMTAVPGEMPGFNAYMQAEIEQRGLEERHFEARKGDVFIWHSQLLHGGTPVENPALTRRSLVTHYFRRDDMPQCDAVAQGEGYWMRRAPQPVPESPPERSREPGSAPPTGT